MAYSLIKRLPHFAAAFFTSKKYNSICFRMELNGHDFLTKVRSKAMIILSHNK